MGPTGSGKTNLALNLSDIIKTEIISADSMQVYKGMDIGTAKPTRPEQKKVPHHMIDILEISERLDIFFYVRKAQKAISEILAGGNTPVIVGGSGLYINSVLYGLDPLPSDTDLRKELLKIGAKVTEKANELMISPCPEYRHNQLLDPHHDHRLAMAFCVLGLKIGVRVKDIECVAKSYPGFVKDLKTMGARINI